MQASGCLQKWVEEDIYSAVAVAWRAQVSEEKRILFYFLFFCVCVLGKGQMRVSSVFWGFSSKPFARRRLSLCNPEAARRLCPCGGIAAAGCRGLGACPAGSMGFWALNINTGVQDPGQVCSIFFSLC